MLSFPENCWHAAVERIWHIWDSQGQILALAFRQKSFKRFKLFPLRPTAAWKLRAESPSGHGSGDTTTCEVTPVSPV